MHLWGEFGHVLAVSAYLGGGEGPVLIHLPARVVDLAVTLAPLVHVHLVEVVVHVLLCLDGGEVGVCVALTMVSVLHHLYGRYAHIQGLAEGLVHTT